MDLLVGDIKQKIYNVRGEQVILDSELAELYETETKFINKAVGRNPKRFPANFAFRLVKEEFESLRFQNGTLKNGRGEHRKYLPYAFTEQGVAMLSGVLNSDRAIEVNVAIIQTFIELRKRSKTLHALAERFHQHEQKFDVLCEEVTQIRQLLTGLYSASTPILAREIPQIELKSSSSLISKDSDSGVEKILTAVSEHFGLRLQTLKKDSRLRTIVIPRQIAMYLIRKHSKLSFQEIGKYFGGKDHTTVLFAYKKIATALTENKNIATSVRAIQNSISS